MKKERFILAILFFFIFLPIANSVFAAYLKFDKDSYSGSVGSEVEVKVIIDTEGEEVVSSDVYISYDATLLEPVNVVPGDFFDTVSYDFLEGKVYIAGMSDNIGVGKKGTGVISTVTFNVKDSGSITLAYICDPNESQSSKIIKVGVDAQNIINCSSNQTATINASSTGSDSSTSSSSSSSNNSSTSSDFSSGSTQGESSSSDKSSNSAPSQLPKSGVFDNTVSLLFWGGLLSIFGIVLKFFFL